MGSNMRLYYCTHDGNPCIGLMYYHTFVVGFLPDDTVVLNAGGWRTVNTSKRINGYTRARVGSSYGRKVMTASGAIIAITTRTGDPRPWVFGEIMTHTPAKIQKCRACKGVGQHTHVQTHEPYHHVALCLENVDNPRRWFVDGIEREFDPAWYEDEGEHEITSTTLGHCWGHRRQLETPVVTHSKCWSCGETGQRDYGSHPVYRHFEDGVIVDRNGAFVRYSGAIPIIGPARDAHLQAHLHTAAQAQRQLRHPPVGRLPIGLEKAVA